MYFLPRTTLILGLGLSVFTLACGGERSANLEPVVQTVSPPPATGPVVDLRDAPAVAEVEESGEAPAPSELEEEEIPPPDLDKALGNFDMTYYWVATEPKRARGKKPILDKNCKRIARVTRRFKRRLTLEGSGLLNDGRLVTTAGGCKCGSPCFWVAGDDYEWGAGVRQRPLNPFRSIAVDPRQIKIGSSLYVAELDGLTMPGSGDEGGFVHDGCVVADDRGGGVRGKQIDFFAARRRHYRAFFKRHKINKVSVYAGGERCKDQARKHAALHPRNRGSS